MQQGLFSAEYEHSLLEQHKQTFKDMLTIVERQAMKPAFIQQKNVHKYYEGCSIGTLLKYERMGLKRCMPVEDGSVFYSVKELDRFMLEHQL